MSLCSVCVCVCVRVCVIELLLQQQGSSSLCTVRYNNVQLW